MKKHKPMGMTGMILIIVVISVILTGIILVSYLAKKTVAKNEDQVLENAYVTVSEPGTITIYGNGSIYEYEGILEEDFTGVADVVISHNKIQKIYAKPDCINGILLSYTDTVIEVQGYGELPRGKDVPVYSLISGGVQEVSFDSSSRKQFFDLCYGRRSYLCHYSKRKDPFRRYPGFNYQKRQYLSFGYVCDCQWGVCLWK